VSTTDGVTDSFNSVMFCALADGTSSRQQTNARRSVPRHPLSLGNLIPSQERDRIRLDGFRGELPMDVATNCNMGPGPK
jgi:hypothetical protein